MRCNPDKRRAPKALRPLRAFLRQVAKRMPKGVRASGAPNSLVASHPASDHLGVNRANP